MWTYRQASGVLDHDGAIVGVGYSGAPGAKNLPSMQEVHSAGPIPRGLYTISGPCCTAQLAAVQNCPSCGGFGAHKHGPFVLRLTPDRANQMFGRGGFLMHGDSVAHPGTASQGCIVMDRAVREKVAMNADNRLEVIA